MSKPFSVLLSESADSVRYMTSGIEHICRVLPPRSPGSDGEREAAAHFAGILRSECGCDSVSVEEFSEHPDAFYGYFLCSMVFDTLCAVFSFFSPVLSLICGATAMLLFIFQFILYKQVIDPLFPKKTGTNVTAVKRCSGEVRRRVFVNGHIDAAWEFPLNYRFGGIVFEIPGVMALIGVLYYMALSVCRLCGVGERLRAAALAGLIFIPFFVLMGFTYDSRRIVDGANDNLSGCFMGIALLRGMERHGIIPEHTEIGVILTGSEEAGLRGAKAWSAAHKYGYNDVPTYILCFDTIHDPRCLMVNVRDLNGTLASDKEMCESFLRAAEDVCVPCKRGWVPPFGGSTDSAAFTQGGFRSMCVTGLSHKLEDYYHTRRDSYDNLDERGLENCYRAAVRFIEAADSGELDG